MDPAKLQTWWFERQGLMAPHPGATPAAALARTGWSRSVGGANPYLAIYARTGASREAIDRAVAEQEVHELPSARGCTYIVPREDYALALAVGHGFQDVGDLVTAKRFLGVTDEEVARLTERVLEALTEGPLDPRELKDRVGDSVRSLGPEGKKRGVTTTLPPVLGQLQARGQIRRIPVNGRLDQQRYRYALWSPSPLDGFPLSTPESHAELAARYFRWIGPASIAQFQWFSGLSLKATKEAVAGLGLVPLEPGSDLLLFPDDREALEAYRAPKEPRYAVVGCMDNMTHLRREFQSLIHPDDRNLSVSGERGLAPVGSLQDVPNHAIFDRGRLIGLWEFDPAEGRIAWMSLVPKTPDLVAAVERTEAWVREELGDARSFSLDSPESRKPKIEELRAG